MDEAKHGELLMPMGKESWSERCAEGLSLQEGAPAAPPRAVAAGTDHDACRGEKEKLVPRGELNI